MKKSWWRSKTLWVNLVAGAALLVQSQFGFIIDAQAQAVILAVVNLVLRLVTKEPIGLEDAPADGGASPTGPGLFPGIDGGGPGAASF